VRSRWTDIESKLYAAEQGLPRYGDPPIMACSTYNEYRSRHDATHTAELIRQELRYLLAEPTQE